MRRGARYLISTVTVIVFAVVFIVPFVFIVLQSLKDRTDAADLAFSWPQHFQLVQNLVDVIQARDYMVVIAFINSAVLTIVSVVALVICSAMVAFVLQRRPSRLNPIINFAILAGLMIPPAVVPTIWVLQSLGLFQTMPGLILVEIAFGMSFSTILFRAFVVTVPRQLDEAAIVDGAGPLRLFFGIILPLLKPVIVTVVVVQSVVIFNDFTYPLYFMPSTPTVQLTLYNFQSQFTSEYNLLFMNILLITIPPLLVFLFFNRQLVAGMTSGAIKG